MTSLVPPGSLYLAGGGQKEKGDVGVGWSSFTLTDLCTLCRADLRAISRLTFPIQTNGCFFVCFTFTVTLVQHHPGSENVMTPEEEVSRSHRPVLFPECTPPPYIPQNISSLSHVEAHRSFPVLTSPVSALSCWALLHRHVFVRKRLDVRFFRFAGVGRCRPWR